MRSARRILKLCDANRGFYVKAGQFVAAVRQVPREYSSTLSSLQDKVLFEVTFCFNKNFLVFTVLVELHDNAFLVML